MDPNPTSPLVHAPDNSRLIPITTGKIPIVSVCPSSFTPQTGHYRATVLSIATVLPSGVIIQDTMIVMTL